MGRHLFAAGAPLDLALRVVAFAAAPIVIVRLHTLYPVTGALVNITLALVVFLFGEVAQHYASRSRLLRMLLNRHLAFEAYYRERDPRPFPYYLFYPLLAPYWLVQRDARREFLLFKGYTLGSLAILLALSGYRFATVWHPVLTVEQFVPTLAFSLLYESVVVIACLMPIATSVVALHKQKHTVRLGLLLAVGALSLGVATWPLLRRHDPIVSLETRTRVRLRTEALPAKARAVQREALSAAWRAQQRARERVEGDGKLDGIPVEVAREVLERFYATDEAMAFDLWATPRKAPKLIVIYTEARIRRAPVWLGLRDDGTLVTDPKKLPSRAFAAMKHAMR